MDFIVPESPLFILSGVLCVLYVYRFWQSRKIENPTNYTLIGKAFAWGLLSCLYIWAGQTDVNILVIRSFVRLGNLILMTVYLFFITLELWLENKYK